MSAIKQYIDFYIDNRVAIDCGSAPALNNLREAALRALDGKELPDKNVEGYEKTSIDEMFSPDFGINASRVNIPVDIARTFRCDVPNLSSMLAVVANDFFVATDTLVNNLPKGATVMSLAKAAREFPEAVGKYYGKIAPIDEPTTALNTLLVQDGVFIKLDRGVRLEKPLQIVNILSSEFPLLTFRRILIVAEAGSAADIIICDHTQNESVECLACQVMEIFVEDDASISILDMEESTSRTRRMNQLYAKQSDRSALTVNNATLLNGSTRNELNVDIRGHHAETRLFGMAIASGTQHIDNSSNVIHSCPDSKSNQRFRYVLDEAATGAFEGSIEVATGAHGTEAYQSNGNVLASGNARMHSKPRLLIFNDDVKCSHGSSTGQLDENALFYMQTRGIPRSEARTMLMQAFVTDVIDEGRPVAARDRLHHLVEKRFAGSLATCKGCSTCETPRH